MSMNLVTLLYLVASVCFIQALKGLSHPTTSIRGNVFGMSGMAIAVLALMLGAALVRRVPAAAVRALLLPVAIVGAATLVTSASVATAGIIGWVGLVVPHIARTLPAYMIPTAIVVIDHLPLNSSGKLDRKALPMPDHDATRRGEGREGRRLERGRDRDLAFC